MYLKSRSYGIVIISLLCVLAHLQALSSEKVPPFQWVRKAPPLPKPQGQVIHVKNVQELFRAAEAIEPGGTIMIADGHYFMPRYFELHTDDITMRSASGKRENVILDGSKSMHGELVGVSRCSGVTIADLTIQNIKYNGFKINSNLEAHRVTIHNCVIHNIWQRGVKGPAVPEERAAELCPRSCRIQHCLFYNDRPKQFSDDPTDRPNTFRGNYIGGIDAMQCRRWTISDNVFYGIRGRTGEARGAVFLWQDSRDCVIERNVILNCDAGICLGNSHRKQFPIHCTGCVVRNNFLTKTPENGILADYTKDCMIAHNTIHDPGSRLKRLIRLVHTNDGLVVANNLLSGPPMRIETKSAVDFRGNVTRVVTGAFTDAAHGDLHLKRRIPGITGSVKLLKNAPGDIDRERRSDPTTAGADAQERS